MKDKIFGVLQRVGRSFMLPIAILPVAGLLLGLGGSFTNETMLKTYGLMKIMGPGTVLNLILQVMSAAGNIIFTNLPVIFAMGVAIGMAKKEKEVAALASVISFFIMHASIGALITANGGADAMLEGAVADVCGITSLQMGVFGGIIVGLGVAALHNRFYKIELPQVLSFFGGTRFVPIISGLVYVGVGILMFFVWPVIQSGIYHIGDLVLKSGYAGTWVYGFMERLLIPFGLHHVFYLPFWQTAVGGTLEVAGKTIEGAQNIFFAQLADPSVKHFAVSATRFMSGKFPLMIFGLPGAALAMYKTAKPEKKKAVAGLLLSAALTSMLTGITEPLEFTFLFIAPVLYLCHAVLAGLMSAITFACGISGDFSLGLIQNASLNWVPLWSTHGGSYVLQIVIGLIFSAIYFVLFRALILKMNLKTPGREADDEESKLYTKKEYKAKKENSSDNKYQIAAEVYMEGLGGKENIIDVTNCATRLRVSVKDVDKVLPDAYFKENGAHGVVRNGTALQVIVGLSVPNVREEFEKLL